MLDLFYFLSEIKGFKRFSASENSICCYKYVIESFSINFPTSKTHIFEISYIKFIIFGFWMFFVRLFFPIGFIKHLLYLSYFLCLIQVHSSIQSQLGDVEKKIQ